MAISVSSLHHRGERGCHGRIGPGRLAVDGQDVGAGVELVPVQGGEQVQPPGGVRFLEVGLRSARVLVSRIQTSVTRARIRALEPKAE